MSILAKPANIDEYISRFPKETQKVLTQLRKAIRKHAPNAEETISYGMPTFRQNGTYLIYFAGYKKHVSIYPVPYGSEAFNRKLSAYWHGKGTVQFSLAEPLPMNVVSRIIKYRIAENNAKAKEAGSRSSVVSKKVAVKQ